MPPLAALRAFSAFAERGGVVAAAEALNVSHAAISQHRRALKAHLDIALLDCSGRALQLTSDGEALAQALTVGFGAIRSTLQEMTQTSGGRSVHIACTPMFATYWLMPRLADFRTRHLEIDLAIDPKGELVELRPGGVDIALRYRTGPRPGLQSEMLLQSPMVVMAPPGLLQDREIKTLQDLLSLPWLEEIGTNEASHWLRSRGVEPDMKAGRVVLPGTLLMNALFAGQGVLWLCGILSPQTSTAGVWSSCSVSPAQAAITSRFVQT